MKIAVYLELSEAGGVDSHLINIIRYWPEPNDRFEILCNSNHKGLKRIEAETKKCPNVIIKKYKYIAFSYYSGRIKKYFSNPIIRIILYLLLPFSVFLQLLQAIRLLRKNDYDALLAYNGGYPAGWGVLASIIAARIIKIKKRVLIVAHAAAKPLLFHGYFERIMDEMISYCSTNMVAISFATRESLLRNRCFNLIKRSIRVIYCGVSKPDNNQAAEKIDIKDKFNLKNRVAVGIVGRIERYKGHEDLIIGYSKIPQELRSKMSLVLIGAGNEIEIERLKAIAQRLNISESIVFTGYLPGDSYDIISQLDMLAVMTKDFEGFGLTLAEAMVIGVPVLATKVGAIPEFVTPENGYLILPESPESVAEALIDFMSNKDQWLIRAQKAQVTIQKFSAQKASEEFNNMFKYY